MSITQVRAAVKVLIDDMYMAFVNNLPPSVVLATSNFAQVVYRNAIRLPNAKLLVAPAGTLSGTATVATTAGWSWVSGRY